MKLTDLKYEQADAICTRLNDLFKVYRDQSNDITLSYIIRKQAIKLAELYLLRCFKVGNAYNLTFVSNIEYQHHIIRDNF